VSEQPRGVFDVDEDRALAALALTATWPSSSWILLWEHDTRPVSVIDHRAGTR
jgi:hypothetical protein